MKLTGPFFLLGRASILASVEHDASLDALTDALGRLAEVHHDDPMPSRAGFKKGMLSGAAVGMIQAWTSRPELHAKWIAISEDMTRDLESRAARLGPDGSPMQESSEGAEVAPGGSAPGA